MIRKKLHGHTALKEFGNFFLLVVSITLFAPKTALAATVMTSGQGYGTLAQTRDALNILPIVLIAIAACIVVVVAAVRSRKKKENFDNQGMPRHPKHQK